MPNGQVWSCHSNKYLKPYYGKSGYPYISMRDSLSGKNKRKYLHRLMATYYVANPHNKPEVNHKDGNRHNYSPLNLEWVTTQENIRHSYNILGRNRPKSYAHPNQKLSDEHIMEIYESKDSESNLARQYGTSKRTVRNIRQGVRHSRITKGGLG